MNVSHVFKSQKLKLGILVLLATTLYFFNLGGYSLIDLDEPRYAEAAREMLEANNYLIPTFNFENRFDKPIFFYWLEMLSFKAFGINEFSARLPSAIAGLALFFFAYLYGKSQKIGLLSGVIVLTSLEIFVMSRLSVTDMVLNLCISAALVVFFLVYSGQINKNWLLAASMSLALGVLTKGPVALLLPLVIVVVFLLIEKSLGFISNNFSLILRCIVLFFAIASPWYVAAHILTEGGFTRDFFLHHNLLRFSGVVSGHDGDLLFYVPVILIGFMPWSIFLPLTAWSLLKQYSLTRSSGAGEKKQCSIISFSLIWVLTFFLFYTASNTKLINYILPVFLPLSFLVANSLSQVSKQMVSRERNRESNLIMRFIFLILVLLFFVLALVHGVLHCDFSIKNYVNFVNKSSILFMALNVFVGSLISLILLIKNKSYFILGFAISAFILFMQSVSFIIEPYSHHREDGIVDFIKMVPEKFCLVTFRMTRPSASFYAHKPVVSLTDRGFRKLVKSKKPFYFISRKGNLKRLNRFKDKLSIMKKDNSYIYGKRVLKPKDVAI